MKTTITCDEWRSLRRNTLLGFAHIKIPAWHLSIRDIAIHEKTGRRWAQLPARPQLKDGRAVTDAAGKVQYFPLMTFDDRATADAFSDAVVAAVLKHDPQAFSEVRPVRAPAMAGAMDDDNPF